MRDDFNSYESYKKKQKNKRAEELRQEKLRQKQLEQKKAENRRRKASTVKKKVKKEEPRKVVRPKKEVKPKLSKEEKKQLKAQKKEEKRARRKENMENLKGSLSAWARNLFIFLVAIVIIAEIMFLLNTQAKLDSIQFKINELSVQIERKNNDIKELSSKKESAYKSGRIENLARNRLGMVYPDQNQIVYINLD